MILLSDLVLASSFSSARCPDFLRAELFPVKRVKDFSFPLDSSAASPARQILLFIFDSSTGQGFGTADFVLFPACSCLVRFPFKSQTLFCRRPCLDFPACSQCEVPFPTQLGLHLPVLSLSPSRAALSPVSFFFSALVFFPIEDSAVAAGLAARCSIPLLASRGPLLVFDFVVALSFAVESALFRCRRSHLSSCLLVP